MRADKSIFMIKLMGFLFRKNGNNIAESKQRVKHEDKDVTQQLRLQMMLQEKGNYYREEQLRHERRCVAVRNMNMEQLTGAEQRGDV